MKSGPPGADNSSSTRIHCQMAKANATAITPPVICPSLLMGGRNWTSMSRMRAAPTLSTSSGAIASHDTSGVASGTCAKIIGLSPR